MIELQKEQAYTTCAWCGSAFSSVLHANLTFFQVITGDGWSLVSRPLIERHPWTAALFLVVIFTMVFGLLNLIVAVIVDGAAQAREEDLMHSAEKKDASRGKAWDCFNELVFDLDED